LKSVAQEQAHDFVAVVFTLAEATLVANDFDG
jgi:hypothetical protein